MIYTYFNIRIRYKQSIVENGKIENNKKQADRENLEAHIEAKINTKIKNSQTKVQILTSKEDQNLITTGFGKTKSQFHSYLKREAEMQVNRPRDACHHPIVLELSKNEILQAGNISPIRYIRV